jgi:soluble lytic murein transglycosylase
MSLKYFKQQVNRPFLLIGVLLFGSLACGCAEEDLVWGRDTGSVMEDLRRGNHGFIAEVETDRDSLKEVSRLGDGAEYYLSFHFEHAGRRDAAVEVLRIAVEEANGIWRMRAYRRLLDLLMAAANLKNTAHGGDFDEEGRFDHSYDEAAAVAAAAGADFPDEYLFRRGLIEARYWSGDDDETLRLLEELAVGRFSRTAADDPELGLFRVVARIRSGDDAALDEVTAFFSAYQAGPLHVRFFDYLRLEGIWPDTVTGSEAAYLRWKDLLGRGEYSLAREKLAAVLSATDLRFSQADLLDLAVTFHRSGADLAGAELLSDPRFPSRVDAPEWLILQERGRLLRYAWRYADAGGAFIEALAQAPQDRRRRLLWYLIDVRIKGFGLREALDLPGLTRYIGDRAYFADIFEETITDLVGRGDWTSLRWLLREGSVWLDGWTKQRCAYILHRLAAEGIISPEGVGERTDPYLSRSFTDPPAVPGQGDHPAGDSAYYVLLYRALHDEGAGDFSEVDAESANEGEGMGETDLFVRGFLEYGLFEEAYREARESGGTLQDSTVRYVCRVLSERGMYLESLRLAEMHLTGDSLPDLERLFPLPYRKEIAAICSEYEIPEHIFRALVREESFYESGIVSHAGAVGLSQLMPATAADMASRLRIDDPDLTHPETNLRLGGYYFSHLLERTGEIGLALASYNAGITRVRRWKQQYAELPSDIFVEAIPFAETRGYVRRVFTAAAAYGILSGTSGLRRTAATFFPGTFSEE